MSEYEKLPEPYKSNLCAELKSGKHRATFGMLRDDSGAVCVLGVACLVGGIAAAELTGLGWPPKSFSVRGVPAQLCRESDDMGSPTDRSRAMVTLSGMNAIGKSFPEIADWISENL